MTKRANHDKCSRYCLFRGLARLQKHLAGCCTSISVLRIGHLRKFSQCSVIFIPSLFRYPPTPSSRERAKPLPFGPLFPEKSLTRRPALRVFRDQSATDDDDEHARESICSTALSTYRRGNSDHGTRSFRVYKTPH